MTTAPPPAFDWEATLRELWASTAFEPTPDDFEDVIAFMREAWRKAHEHPSEDFHAAIRAELESAPVELHATILRLEFLFSGVEGVPRA